MTKTHPLWEVSFPTTHLWGLYKFLHENAPHKPQRMKRIHFKATTAKTLSIHLALGKHHFTYEKQNSLTAQLLPPARKPWFSCRTKSSVLGLLGTQQHNPKEDAPW